MAMTNSICNNTVDYIALDVVEDEDNVVAALEDSIRKRFSGHSPLSVTNCIFRVPQVLRSNNPKAYQPDIISIGPFHNRGRKQFQYMEKVKQWYLHNYILSRENVSLKTLIQFVMKHEERARGFYAEPLDHLKQNDFIEMMVLDGCFLVELFRKSYYETQRKNNDPIFRMDCMFQYICHDLLLLENQLPWFILINLYSLTKGAKELSFTNLILIQLSTLPPLKHNCVSYSKHIYENHLAVDVESVFHILDLVRTSVVFSIEESDTFDGETNNKKICTWIPKKRRKSSTVADAYRIPSAITLSEAGVKFKVGPPESKSIMDITFEGGVFKIPYLAIGELTESLLRNLIAFEQCYHDRRPTITSYAILLDKLIASPKDMEFLCDKKIIGNWLSAEDGSQFFNKLYNDTVIPYDDFYYTDLCNDLNRYYRVKWHGWLEKLNRDYFNNPWSLISLIAAIVLLGLTMVQTIYTAHP